MVGFRIGNTLSESGTVSRGLCSTDANNLLTSVVERTKIQRMDGEVRYIDDNGEWTATPDTTPVSMNFWGFTPDYFAYSAGILQDVPQRFEEYGEPEERILYSFDGG